MAADRTASASTEITSVEQAASRTATAFGEVTELIVGLGSRANDLEMQLAEFFNRVRAA
jgi:ABC-type hemin transport system substrate-binding protein